MTQITCSQVVVCCGYMKSHKPRCLTGEVIMWCKVVTEQTQWPWGSAATSHLQSLLPQENTCPVGQISLLFKKQNKTKQRLFNEIFHVWWWPRCFLLIKNFVGQIKHMHICFVREGLFVLFTVLSLCHQMSSACRPKICNIWPLCNKYCVLKHLKKVVLSF